MLDKLDAKKAPQACIDEYNAMREHWSDHFVFIPGATRQPDPLTPAFVHDGNLCASAGQHSLAAPGDFNSFAWYCDRQCFKFCPTASYQNTLINMDSCSGVDDAYFTNASKPGQFSCSCGYPEKPYK